MAFQIAGGGILLLFYGSYLAKMFRQRTQGIRTDQLGRGKAGAERLTEWGVKAAAWAVLAAEAVSLILNVHGSSTAVRILGGVLGAAGGVVFAMSVWTMGDSWRAGVPREDRTELVTGGIYRFSRNPAFLGFDLLYAGMALMFWNGILAGLSLFAAVMLHRQIVRVEEPFLRETFGAEYEAYRARVCRYFGRR